MQDDIGQGVLDGVRVLEVGGEIGAWCGKLMGDVGADVIKVEPPTGDPTRSFEPFYENEQGPDRSLFFWHYNTSKRSVTLDLEHDRGRESSRGSWPRPTLLSTAIRQDTWTRWDLATRTLRQSRRRW